MNDFENELLPEQSAAQRHNAQFIENPDDAYLKSAADIRQSKARPPSDRFDVSDEDEWQDVDHPEARADREWAARRKDLGFERKKLGKFHSGVKGVVGATGNAITRIGAAGAQDAYTAGKVLGGIGAGAKGVVDTTKDLSKIGQGVDKLAGLKGENSILEQNIPYLGFNMNTIAKAELAPGIKVADTAKAALQDGGTLLEVAGRGITAASGRKALDFGDDQRRQYMEKRDAFTSARDQMRAKLAAGERGGGKAAFEGAVGQTQAALDLGRAVNEYGIRPEYEYSMNESADINNMTVKRTNEARTMANPSFDPGNPQSQAQVPVKPGEVTFERNAGTDALNAEPDYQTNEELRAGKRAKRLAAPGEALEGLGRVLDGSEHGQEAVRKGEYLKGATQATLAGARTVGKGVATAAAAPLGLGLATSALVDVGTVAAGGLLQGIGGGINAVTGVGAKADQQRATELRNKHYFGKEHFLKSSPAIDEAAPAAELEEEAKQAAEAPADKEAVPADPHFDSARGRRIAERGLRARSPLKEGDYEKDDRDAGLPAIDHGGAFKNFWHNRMKRPLKKVGQGLVKPLALLAKGLGTLTGVLPAYKYFQNKKRKKAIEAATNRKNNRVGGALQQDDWEMANHPDEKQAPAVPQYSGPEDQDKVLQSLEGRKADAEINRVELRNVLDKQNKSYESSKLSRGAKAALKMEGRDLAKENVTAWQNFERRHNETRLAQKIADRKRERAKDPATGESFLERQKREYLDWLNKKKASDVAGADVDNAAQRVEASDPDSNPPALEEAKEAGDDEGGSLDGFRSDSEGDVGSLDGEGSSRGSSELAAPEDRISAAQEVLRGRRIRGGHAGEAVAQAARQAGPMAPIQETDSDEEDAAEEESSVEEEMKEAEAPQRGPASPWFEQVPGLGPIQDEAPQQEKVPFGFTPEAYAEEQRAWKKALRQKS